MKRVRSALMSEVWIEGYSFPESPRWYRGEFWFVDMYLGDIWKVDSGGHASCVISWSSAVGGLGWLPDGDLLFVDKYRRAVMRCSHTSGETSIHADLSPLAASHLNDMLTLPDGRSYIGEYGFDIAAGENFAKGSVFLVEPDGGVSVATSGLAFPNGIAITGDGERAVVAESAAGRLVQFRVDAAAGALVDRSVLMRLDKGAPDGICMDAEGAVWVAALGDGGLLRIGSDGQVLASAETRGVPIACALGGEDGRSLYVTTAEMSPDRHRPGDYAGTRTGAIEVVEVAVPAALLARHAGSMPGGRGA
ncbi:SMP-30/gluconolactonase/LRE family protein [Parahaliea mediterranea]|uniref:SMP-30/gluconolactonase/LRE family protein n=1 Tax=Parahaliea mediterranea TaxID=651086 RepID=A0A939DG74_9GAMM|nr:SMP-30/gluconolactonase/LRE family protein [Parahaliea mediterranea]MBN7797515.1 SMP-30/gluconolactonase/LRE family protein [Parahaliea mediterranea]